MVNISKITPTTIELAGISFEDADTIETIMSVCHKYKHLYLEGFPCGKKTRKASTEKMKKWTRCPEICFVYLVTSNNDRVIVKILISDEGNLLKKIPRETLDYYTQMFVQDVADGIMSALDANAVE